MLNVNLSWDLFIVVFFAIVMSYSFIIGKHQAMKIIIASYVSIIATQGIGNVLGRFLGQSATLLTSVGIPVDLTLLALAKVFLFAICIVIFVTRSGIDVSYDKDHGTVLTLVYTGLYGFATAGLLVSTILTFAAGGGLLDGSIAATGTVSAMALGSPLMQLLILNQDIWFTLPAFLIIVTGLVHSE